MTPEQAIQILDNLVAQMSLTRRDHELALQSVMLLRDLTVGKPAVPAPIVAAELPDSPAKDNGIAEDAPSA